LDRSRARRDGKRDGLLGVPAQSEVAYPPALLAIKQRGEEALAALQRSWASRDARLSETTDVAERRAASLAGSVEANRDALAHARTEAVPSRDDPVTGSAATGGPRIGRVAYGVLITAILVAEFPLNAIAFRLFGESEVLTWVMTAGLAATLILCAHGLGAFLRAPHPSMADRRWIVVLLVLPTLTIVGIAVIRERYLSMAAETGGFDALGPVVGSLLFLVINLLIYAGATMLSYLAHAPGQRASKRSAPKHELEDAKARQAQLEARAEAGVDAAAAARRAAVEARRVAAAHAQEIRSYYEQLMAIYCTANLRARRSPEVPAVLREHPTIEIPVALQDEGAAPLTVGPGTSENGHASGRSVAAVRHPSAGGVA
jgi:hypothetical protein